MERKNLLKRPRTSSFDIYWGEVEEPEAKHIFEDEKFVYTIGNEIHFTANINKISIQEIIKQMTTLIHEHEKKNSGDEKEKLNIVYIIDSPGGSVTSILKFVDFINVAKKKYDFVEFTSIITGLTASAGTIMAIVADKRYMTKNAHAMVHELASGNSGKYTEFRSYVKFLDQLHDKLVTIYCNRTGKIRTEIEAIMRNETWFTANEYLEFGFIDEIK